MVFVVMLVATVYFVYVFVGAEAVMTTSGAVDCPLSTVMGAGVNVVVAKEVADVV
jgi:hypothetical protein